MKQTLLKVARGVGLFALSRWLTRDRLRILCYHGIWDGPAPHYGDCLFMDAQRFAQRMQRLADCGYRVISLDEAVKRQAQRTNRATDVVITIDDAWLSTYRHMVPVLERHGYPATLYVTTYYTLAERPVLNVMLAYIVERASNPLPWADLLPGVPVESRSGDRVARLVARVEALPTLEARHAEVRRIAELAGVDCAELERRGTFMLMNGEQVRDASKRGIDIQLHTHTHRMHDYVPERVEDEVSLNRARLAEILGAAPEAFRHFCYPSGEYHPRVFDALRTRGVVSATTTEFGINEPGAEPLALKRILDCQSFSDIEFEARICGFWSILVSSRSRLRTLFGRSSA